MRLKRLLILSWLVLRAVLPVEAGVRSEKGKGHPMTQRILFHPAPTADWVKGLKVETLGKIPRGIWLAADDATALELLKRDKSTLMLYPARAELNEAMEGLTEAETAEAVTLRLALVEANPQNESMVNFFTRARTTLAGMAAVSNMPGSAGSEMRSAYNRQLELLRILRGGDDKGGFGAVSLLEGAFAKLNLLNWEVEALHGHVGDALPPAEPDLDKSRLDLALQLELGSKKHGAHPGYVPKGRVDERLERGIHATPFDERLVRGIREGGEPVQEWKDGFVCIWSERQFGQLPIKEKKKAILYYDARTCQSDFMTLTKSQLLIRFSRRAKLSRAEDARAYLAQLKLEAVLELRNKEAGAARFEKPIAESMSRHAGKEAESLRQMLAGAPIWRQKQASGTDEIKAEMASALSEVEFWNAWATRSQWFRTLPMLEDILAAMRKSGPNPPTKP